MDPKNRLLLNKLVSQYESEDTTEKIRELKHSKRIYDDVCTIQKLKRDYSRLRETNKDQFVTMMKNRAPFLYENYSNIFHRLKKDQVNIQILFMFLKTLEAIENGEVDQNEASVQIGQLLKEIYVDKVIDTSKEEKKVYKKPKNDISWKQYRTMKDITI